jgi:hypothetical protein
MPEFHDMEPAHQDWKRQVMAGEIQLEEIDTTPHQDRFGKLAKIAPKTQAAE